MSFHITTQYGAMEEDVSPERLIEVLRTITPDHEHPDVSLTHESEWCLSVFGSGLVVIENLEGDEPRHMRLASPMEALPLWQKLAAGDLQALNALPWLPGYGNRG